MLTSYGLERVLEPKYVLPTSAWKLDNSRNIHPDEIRISIRRITIRRFVFGRLSEGRTEIGRINGKCN